MGITDAGVSAEDRFRLLTGAERTGRKSDGDARIGSFYFEVKFVGGPEVVNQVRAEKWLTLVVLHRTVWYVIPPQDVARMAATKLRGQHGANPFESARLSVRNFGAEHVVSERNLRARALAAALSGEEHAATRQALKDLRAAICGLVDEARDFLSLDTV
jgi:hypothetical protein